MGSLHLAYHEDEAAVLNEFLASAPQHGYKCEWLSPAQTLRRSAAVNPHNPRGALWSPTEICVAPREILAQLPDWLHKTYGVWFEFDCTVTAYQQPVMRAGGRE